MKVYFLIAVFAIFASCRDPKTSNRITNGDSEAVVSTSANHVKSESQDEKYVEVLNWVDDFKNFRMALYNKDAAKLKTYFAFPLNTDTTFIWTPVTTNEGENKVPKLSDPGKLSENDFEKYYPLIFRGDFVKSVLKIKSEKLLKTGNASTSTFKGEKEDYLMDVNLDANGKSISLNLSYSHLAMEGSEDFGEYNIIYIFKIIDGKRLLFDKILMAG